MAGEKASQIRLLSQSAMSITHWNSGATVWLHQVGSLGQRIPGCLKGNEVRDLDSIL